MNRAQTRVLKQTTTQGRRAEFRTAVSLHSHTHHSKESAEFLPVFIQRVPVLNQLIPNAIRSHEERTGTTVDFRRVYWTPPVSPSMVLQSEISQIEEQLDLQALVSITDHDTIAAGLELQGRQGKDSIPISVEWTVPFGRISFHVGVHYLPPGRAVEIMEDLSRCTAEPSADGVSDLFALLDSTPETLLVLNHPCCNHSGVGAVQHAAEVREFLSRYRRWIHALEFNGMRPQHENQEAVELAEEYDLPVVGGGDRHGCCPNTVLNLSPAESWGEYVEQIRCGRQSDVIVMPACEESVLLRELQTVGDIVRHYPNYRYGYRQFTDRVFVDLEGYSWHPLSFYWSGGMPLWLRPLFGGLSFLGGSQLRPILRYLLSQRQEKALATLPSEVASN